ncbi:MAG: iduronate-2-sulfatase [Bacteroidia bacterium]|nr:MAG: iduronate-2-sulfatase [Bacteroidia bacterium]
MNITKYSSSLLPFSLGAVLLTSSSCAEASQKKPAKSTEGKPMNVLFFVSDDMRPNLGCYGDKYAVTPNIDRMAAEGVVFSHAYCQQAVSNPSRTSLLTGLRPDETGVINLETHFRTKLPDLVTLPQLFKNNGYLTLGTGKVFHALKETVDPVSWSEPVPDYEGGGYFLPENQIGKGKQNSSECADVPDTTYVDGKMTIDAIKYLARAKEENRPFFIAVGYKKPHAPYVAPQKYWDIYKDKPYEITDRERPVGAPALAFHNNEEIRGYRDVPEEGPIPPEKEQEIVHGYYACISYVDAQIGKVLAALDSLGLRDNTIIVFWGDHGYHLGEQDLWCKSTNFELAAKAPLIISAPGMTGNGNRSDAIVEFVDVYPTLAALAGLTPQGGLSGTSLTPLLKNPDAKWKDVAFNQFTRPYRAIRKFPPTHMGYSVRTRDWRCTYWWDLNTGEVVEKELYNLKDNRIEKVNLAGNPDYSKIENKMAQMVTDYRDGKYSSTEKK